MVLTHVVDTDIAVEMLRARDLAVVRKAGTHRELGISSMSVFELTYGALKATEPIHRERLATLESVVTVLDFDAEAAADAAEIRLDLQRRGTPIGAYDTLIAGHARSRGLVLVTRNVREFERVPGLRVERW